MRRERITITIRKDVISKLDSIIDGQNIRNRSNAIETIILKQLKTAFPCSAVILAGDNGINIDGKDLPKILLPLNGKTLVEKNIEILKRYGITEIIINVTKKWKAHIKNSLGDGGSLGVKITYRENKGTGGILQDIKNAITGTFLMINGDILLETIDLEDMYNFHKKRNGWGTIAVATAGDPSKLGTIVMKGDTIVNFLEKTEKSEQQTYMINGGVYMLEPKVFSIIQSKGREKIMIESDVFPKLAADEKLFGYQIGKDWIHLHEKKDLDKYLSGLKK